MFQIRDTFGGTKLLLEQLEQDTREGFDAACTAAAFMAERGELIRRRLGYAPGEIPDADTFRLLVPTYEIVDLKNAVIKAVTLGTGGRSRAPRTTNTTRASRNSVKKNTIKRAEYYRIAARCGISVTEALFMPPGELFDLWELYLRDHGKRDKEGV